MEAQDDVVSLPVDALTHKVPSFRKPVVSNFWFPFFFCGASQFKTDVSK